MLTRCRLIPSCRMHFNVSCVLYCQKLARMFAAGGADRKQYAGTKQHHVGLAAAPVRQQQVEMCRKALGHVLQPWHCCTHPHAASWA